MDDFMARFKRCFSWTSVGELVNASVRFVIAPLDGPRCSTAFKTIQKKKESNIIKSSE